MYCQFRLCLLCSCYSQCFIYQLLYLLLGFKGRCSAKPKSRYVCYACAGWSMCVGDFWFFFGWVKRKSNWRFCCMKRDDLNISLSSDQLINLQYLHNIFIYTQAYIIIIMLFLWLFLGFFNRFRLIILIL